MNLERDSARKQSKITVGQVMFLIPALGILLALAFDYWCVRSEVGSLQQEVQTVKKQSGSLQQEVQTVKKQIETIYKDKTNMTVEQTRMENKTPKTKKQ